MDQNQHKMVIGVLSIVALGAGVYWGFLRESSAASDLDQNMGLVEVRQRPATQIVDKEPKGRSSKPAASTEASGGAVRRQPDQQPGPVQHTRRPPGEKLVKNTKRPPAA
jgi:hypothetical protein